MSSPLDDTCQSLAGVRVLDIATLFAGPVVGTLMADFGADVIKIEHPRGDSLRDLGWKREDVSLWWTIVNRNKRSIAVDLSHGEGQSIIRRLVEDSDVLIENFRPGTLERWNLAPDDLLAINPRLVILRMTAFGQTGPYSSRPGFGTLAEALSGYAHMNGYADGPPTLPPLALADGVAALAGTVATMFALWWRDHGGHGQVVDCSIYEPLFWILGPQALVYDQLGIVQGRTGNSAPYTAPRNMYRASDGQWLALSASAQSIAERVMRIVGHEELIDEPWFTDHMGRLEHAAELDAIIQTWIGARTSDEVCRVFVENNAAIAPAYSIEQIFGDPHYQARESMISVTHPVLGEITMQNMIAKLSSTPGTIRSPAGAIGCDTYDVLAERLGFTPDTIDDLESAGVISTGGGKAVRSTPEAAAPAG